MGSALMILELLIPLLAQVPLLIQAAEAAFSHVDKSGAAKKSFVMQAVQTGISAAAQLGGVKELNDPAAQKVLVDSAGALTDAVVASFNAFGAFHHGDVAPQA
jgi:hypothetical protein